MIKFNEEYNLSENNYNNVEYKKTQIIIGHSLSDELKHFDKWKTILNGEYKNTSPFTISRDGTIYKHYNPKYYSNFINIGPLDRKVISITLENEGSLWKNNEKNCYNTYLGTIYNSKKKVIETKWRDRQYWASYTTKQINSLVKLCKELCLEFDIPMISMDSNTVKHAIQDFKGIAFRSNFSKYYYDVSPAFDVSDFKNKIEK